MSLLYKLAIFSLIIGYASAQQTCQAHAAETCRDSTGKWTDGSVCNAIYGNIDGNKRNLGKLMTDHFKQSFQFIAMVSLYF